ncbi:hypothetical protein F2Q70_00025908 [Brassica cretica]|uniref:Uncharacterized protein n=1 Tax=Brassica cretica TaxID=69181 RepID=A0A8S9LDS2_BRACR|nr:hypothetical protein F2Q70_00025908 [Brassica cretica]
MNPELLAFPSSLMGGRPRPLRLFTDPFSSPIPSWGDVPEADSEGVPMAPLKRRRSCLWKGHLREFLSEKAKSHLSKETTVKPTEAAPVSPPRKDRVIHVISGGSEISGISHAAAKRSTWNSKHGLEAAKPKRMLLGTDEISFTAKEQEKFLTPHHDALVISLTIAKCLVKRILVDNGSSSNIIFQAAYKDLGLEKAALTRRVTPLIDHSEGKDQGLIAITEQTSGSSHRGTGGRRNG